MISKSLSVIIPTYQLSSGSSFTFFHALINSIIDNCKHDSAIDLIQVIIINDSPDDFPLAQIRAIFRERAKDSILLCVNNTKNHGQAHCRNVGAKLAEGEYLHFIDQDDYILANFYENLSSSDAEFIMSDLWFDVNGLRKKSYYKSWTKLLLQRTNDFRQLSFLLFSNIAVSPGQYLIKNTLFKEVGGFPNLINKGSDDFAFLFNLSSLPRAISFKFEASANFVYRIHPNQGSKTLILHNSVNEFFENRAQTVPLSVLHRLIFFVRTHASLTLASKLFYVTFFNRAGV